MTLADAVGPMGIHRSVRLFVRGPAWARLVCLALAVGVAYGLLHEVAFWFQSPSGGAAFYPPAGLALGLLLLTPRRTWPVWLAMFMAAHIVIDLAHGRPQPSYLAFTLADALEPLVGALLLSVALRQHRGPRASLINFAVFPVAVAPLVAGVVGVTTYNLLGRDIPWWHYVQAWWIGDALGVLVVGGVILAWAQQTPFELPFGRQPPPRMLAAVSAVAAAAIITTGVLWHYPLVFVVLPALVWAAFAAGARGVTAVGGAAAVAAYWVALTGRAEDLFGPGQRDAGLLLLQLFVGVTFLTGLFLAAEIAERRRVEGDVNDVREQLAASQVAAIQLLDAERRSIMQETHDLVGHGLNAMLLQLGAAQVLLDTDPARAHELLASARATGERACSDLEVVLSLDRKQGDADQSPGLDRLNELVAALRHASLPIELCIDGERGELSTLVDWSGYRIVLEALTNVLKHAPGASTTVTVRFDDAAIHLAVVDDGGSIRSDRSRRDGQGITGMRERAAALGGTLDLGPNPGGGYTVTATLPRAPRQRP